MSSIKMIPMGNNKFISPQLLDRWIRFTKQEPELTHISNPREYLLENRIDPRNYCISNGLIDNWLGFE